MLATAHADGRFRFMGGDLRCAVGRAGVVPATEKREGDGATPAGEWALLKVFFRADRGPAPKTGLPTQAMWPNDGWCDDPADRRYNTHVQVPIDASAEDLWRDDGLYDLIVVLGYNTDPVVSGAGSAIFLHCAAPDLGPTAGCVALAKADLLRVLEAAKPGDVLAVEP